MWTPYLHRTLNWQWVRSTDKKLVWQNMKKKAFSGVIELWGPGRSVDLNSLKSAVVAGPVISQFHWMQMLWACETMQRQLDRLSNTAIWRENTISPVIIDRNVPTKSFITVPFIAATRWVLSFITLPETYTWFPWKRKTKRKIFHGTNTALEWQKLK